MWKSSLINTRILPTQRSLPNRLSSLMCLGHLILCPNVWKVLALLSKIRLTSTKIQWESPLRTPWRPSCCQLSSSRMEDESWRNHWWGSRWGKHTWTWRRGPSWCLPSLRARTPHPCASAWSGTSCGTCRMCLSGGKDIGIFGILHGIYYYLDSVTVVE